jgi:hypothetical protein
VFEMAGQYNDCGLLLEGVGPLSPGEEAIVPIEFVFQELVVERLQPGASFRLWEGKFIADGTVVRLEWHEPRERDPT